MFKKCFIVLVAFFCIWITMGAPAEATTIDSIVAFGDSMSDSGNLFSYTGHPPAPYYYEGRFSNGPLWVEYLAETLDSPLDNRAFGGATTGDYNYATGKNVWGLKWQIDTYLTQSPVFDADILYTIWAGGNDYFTDPYSDPSVSVGNIGYALNRLSNAGAHNILVVSVPDLGITPEFSVNPGVSAHATGWSSAFNEALYFDLADFESEFGGNLFTIDAFAAFDAIAGGFANTTDAYLPDGFAAGLNPDDFMDWDGVHATTRVHHQLAGIAADTVTPVPEPTALVLLGTGIIGLAGLGRKKILKP